MKIRKATKKMKKLTIIFGGSYDFYYKNMNVFAALEKALKFKLKHFKKEKLTAKIKDVELEIRFAYNPTRDKNYLASKKCLEIKWKQSVPLPADEVVKKIKKTDSVLFLGHCGGFKGKPGEIFLPEKFKEIFFEDIFVKHKEIIKTRPKNPMHIKNILTKKMSGKKATVITSNLTLNPSSIENKSEKHLIKLAKILSNAGDVVEKESYPIVKYFRKKVPLGVMMVSSDVLSIKKHMMTENFKPDKNKFSKACINAVKVVLKELR